MQKLSKPLSTCHPIFITSHPPLVASTTLEASIPAQTALTTTIMATTIYVALLRGINVNGHRIIKMADLRESLEQEGSFSLVKTWLQSGNVLVQPTLIGIDPIEISNKIKAVIKRDFGLHDVPVMIRTIQQIQDTISCNPFSSSSSVEEQPYKYETKRIFVAFLNELPCSKLLNEMDQIDFGKEKYILNKELNAIYFYIPDFAKYKLDTTLFEKKLKIIATSRNWKTTNKLIELSNEMSMSKKSPTVITVAKNNNKKEAVKEKKQTNTANNKKKGIPPPPRRVQVVGSRRSKRQRS